MESLLGIKGVILLLPSLPPNRMLITKNGVITVPHRLVYSCDEVTAQFLRLNVGTILSAQEHAPDLIEAIPSIKKPRPSDERSSPPHTAINEWS